MIRRLLIRLLRLDVTGEIARLDLAYGREKAARRSAEEARDRARSHAATLAQLTGEAEVRAAELDRRQAEIAGILYAAQGTPEERLDRIGEALGEGRHRA